MKNLINFNEMCAILHNKFIFKNVLVIRSLKTGKFLDDLVLENVDIKRITYVTNNMKKYINKKIQNEFYKRNNICIMYDKLNNELDTLNIKYDLICVDPYHEYEHSYNNLFKLKSLLNDDGIMICHDCYPLKKNCVTPYFIHGEWYGVTYAVFVELIYENPNLYYSVLNVDCRLGIISKKQIDFVKNNFDNNIQKKFIDLFKSNDDETYDFFIQNANELVNLINL